MPGILTLTDGFPGVTFSQASTNTSQGLPDAVLELSGTPIRGVIIYVDNNPIRYTFGVAPTLSPALGLVAEQGGKIILRSFSECVDFRFISRNSGAAALLQIAPTYDEEV